MGAVHFIESRSDLKYWRGAETLCGEYVDHEHATRAVERINCTECLNALVALGKLAEGRLLNVCAP